MSVLDATVDRVRQPEYTGENRCTPCTVLNVLIAAVLAIGIGLVSVPAALVAFVVFLGLIYVRGYLVPGTPQLTQRYFPERVLRAFDKQPSAVAETDPPDEATVDDDIEPEDVEALLRSAGIVEEDDENDLRLGEEFAEVWWRRIRRYNGSDEDAKAQLAAVLGIDPADLRFENGDQFVVSYEDDVIGRWASDAAFYADLAVEPTLSEWLPEWEEFGDHRRTQLIAGMRVFLEECPACEAELSQVEDVRKSCCSSEIVNVSVDCPECDARVFSGSYR